MAMLTPATVNALLVEHGLRPKKSLGQNFLVDPNTARRIVARAELPPGMPVLEIGPGLGSLTLALVAEGHEVVALELDARLAEVLRSVLDATTDATADADAEGRGRVRIEVGDACAVDLQGLLEGTPGPWACVSNLPYNVAVPVVLHLLQVVPTLRTVLVMVQKEVADRLAAGPGSRVYGVPSVKARWYCDVEAAGNIGTSVFWPVPHVESGLVRMIRREPPPSQAGRAATFVVIDAAFSQRRKTLRSALSAVAGSPAAAEQALRAAGVEPSLRGEQLDVAAFARIADALEGERASTGESA